MKTIILLTSLVVFYFSSFQVDISQNPKQQQSTKDTTLAMLTNHPYQKEIAAIVQASLHNKNKIVLMSNKQTYAVTDENLSNILLNNPKATLQIIKHPDSIIKILPKATNISAILMVGDK